MEKGSELDVAEKDSPSARLGWRFAVGVVLIVGGYIAWTLIPVAVATDLPTGVKSALTALLGATPFLTKVAAVALMGRPAYDLFKRSVLKSLRLRASS
jgi:predicted anti-sigma-YlaC factor YlaD